LWRCSELLTYNYTVCNKKYDTEFELLRAMRGEQSPLQKKKRKEKRKWKERQNACEQKGRIERSPQKCVRRRLEMMAVVMQDCGTREERRA